MRGVDLHLSLLDGTYFIHTQLRFASSTKSLAGAQLVSCIVAEYTTLVPQSHFLYLSYFFQQNITGRIYVIYLLRVLLILFTGKGP